MFDAVVIGSGMSGGIAAKELCERGLKVLVLERGRHIEPGKDYTDNALPWEIANANMIPETELDNDYQIQRQCYALNESTRQFWVKDSEHPYTTSVDKPFSWIRGYHLGGRSITWGRQSYRLSEIDFEANKKDGHGVDWPIRYKDLAPWYSHVERFVGVAGSREGLSQLPDGEFLPAFGLNDGEQQFKAVIEQTFPSRHVIPGRAANLSVAQPHHEELNRYTCQNRSICDRGCSFGASFSSLSASLPAAKRTGNLTVVTDAIVTGLDQDPVTGRIIGVRVIDSNTHVGRIYKGKLVFLCASAIASAAILLNSCSDANPRGLCNKSDQVGRNLMDHLFSIIVRGMMPGPQDSYYKGRRPTGFYIPRYRNVTDSSEQFVRGYGYQGALMRIHGPASARKPGLIGEDLKEAVRTIGPWFGYLSGFGEMLPNPNNRVTLSKSEKDRWGVPVVHIDCEHGANEKAMASQILIDGKAMIEAAGGRVISEASEPAPPGLGVHEMGTARMGRDPNTSVLNAWNQAHEAPNLFCTDGAAMTSSGCQNPSLTYMALTARAADYAARQLAEGRI